MDSSDAVEGNHPEADPVQFLSRPLASLRLRDQSEASATISRYVLLNLSFE